MFTSDFVCVCMRKCWVAQSVYVMCLQLRTAMFWECHCMRDAAAKLLFDVHSHINFIWILFDFVAIAVATVFASSVYLLLASSSPLSPSLSLMCYTCIAQGDFIWIPCVANTFCHIRFNFLYFQLKTYSCIHFTNVQLMEQIKARGWVCVCGKRESHTHTHTSESSFVKHTSFSTSCQ